MQHIYLIRNKNPKDHTKYTALRDDDCRGGATIHHRRFVEIVTILSVQTLKKATRVFSSSYVARLLPLLVFLFAIFSLFLTVLMRREVV